MADRLNSFGYALDIDFLDQINLDDALFYRVDDSTTETAFKKQQSSLSFNELILLPHEKNQIADTADLCKSCFSPLVVYFLSFNRALKLCTNIGCPQYTNNKFELGSCIVNINVNECKHPRANETQSKQLEIILNKHIELVESRLDTFVVNATQVETQTEPTIPTHQSINFSDLILDFEFPADEDETIATAINNSRSIDLNTDVHMSSFDSVLNKFDQSTQPLQIGFRTLLEEGSSSQTSSELKSFKPAQAASDMVNQQFFASDNTQMLVSHSKRNTSSITITKKPYTSNNIIDNDDLATITNNLPPKKITSTSIRPTQSQYQSSNNSLLLPWEIKTKISKRKSRLDMDEIDSKETKRSQVAKTSQPVISKTNLSRSSLETSLREKGAVLKNALLTNPSFLANVNHRATSNYKELVLNVLKRKV